MHTTLYVQLCTIGSETNTRAQSLILVTGQVRRKRAIGQELSTTSMLVDLIKTRKTKLTWMG